MALNCFTQNDRDRLSINIMGQIIMEYKIFYIKYFVQMIIHLTGTSSTVVRQPSDKSQTKTIGQKIVF